MSLNSPVQLAIDPALDEQKRIRSLVPLLGKDSSFPVEPPALNGVWDIDVEVKAMSTSAAAQLGVSAVFSASTTVNSTTLIWDAMVGKNAVLDSPTPTSVIYETFWGVGLRVGLTYLTTDISASANVAVVAANAEFKSVDVQYEIHAIGLGPAELARILRTLPPLGKFDLSTFAQLEDVRLGLKDALMKRLPSSGDPKVVLRPVAVKLSASPFSDAMTDAVAYRFTMQCLEAGLTLAETLAYLPKSDMRTVQAGRVTEIYKSIAGTTETPTPAMRSAARTWLQVG